MTHEFKNIITQAIADKQKGIKSVLATVVDLEGSSYRKPGVRMLISEDMTMTGAVSGGCVEAEVRRRAQSVFQDGKSKMMTYDGRFRLGCEGTLYILLELIDLDNSFIDAFYKMLDSRKSFQIESYYLKEDDVTGDFGSQVTFDNDHIFQFNTSINTEANQKFSQTLNPSPRLVIIGAEHDAVKLCRMASLLGWEIDVITSINDPKQLSDFPGAKSVTDSTPELFDLKIDKETIVVLMTHNYALDLKYLIKLTEVEPKYIGILGSVKRRERLQNDLFSYKEDLDGSFLDAVYSPAGLHIGAITPEEIALSILSEILSVLRKTKPTSLRTLSGKSYA
ncbi:XdhC family protein [Winogradskyella tangerina]|uniref:XdhC family protein n=1 Tax=Winogradskyella tangerina TaxID=2023240 RepID=UPI000DBEA309|nr:XdhC/CoxI family protein [Winogradskyella tangerina]